MSGGELKMEDGAGTGHYVGFKATDGSVSSDVIWSLPSSDGTVGQLMSTDGSMNIVFVANMDSILQANINTETTSRMTADGVETTARMNGDLSEVTARTNADLTLQANINSEATARLNRDSSLQTNINNETTSRMNSDSTLQTNLNTGLSLLAGSIPIVDLSSMINVPNTTISGRSQIPDIANDLKASMGIDRILTQNLYQVNEFASTGEMVFGVMNDDYNLIRFVGSGWTTHMSTYGQYVLGSGNTTDYVEVCFYGTGINLLTILYTGSGSYDYRVTVDALSEVTFLSLVASTLGTNITNKLYSPNQIVSVAANLSLGIHTVKIRSNNGNIPLMVSGFEILNISGNVNINAGTAYKYGQKYVNTLPDSVPYATGVTGTTGGCLVQYLNTDGTVGQAFTPCSASSYSYFASTNHTNEDVVRKIYWREFTASGWYSGIYDFALMGVGSTYQTFTLDDGVTSLVASNVNLTIDPAIEWGFYISSSGGYFIFTFEGTGLDIIGAPGMLSPDPHAVVLDGVSLGNLPTGSDLNIQSFKIVSGLPFGTHTVKITRTGAAGGIPFRQFIVYQAKKPSIPTTSIELCSYNVMANYAPVGTVGSGYVSQGVRRKVPHREFVYSGTGWTVSQSGLYDCGSNIYTSTATNYVAYTFFGTGLDIGLYFPNTGSVNATVSIVNVVTNTPVTLSSYTTAIVPATPLSFNNTNGLLSGTLAAGTVGRYKIQISGLPLSLYTVKILQNTTVTLQVEYLDIITPIQAYKYNIPMSMQGSFTIGSTSLSDSRRMSPTIAKNMTQAVGIVAGGNTDLFSAWIKPIVPDMFGTIKTLASNKIEVIYSISFGANGQANPTTYLFVDGVPYGSPKTSTIYTSSCTTTISDVCIVPVTPGSHFVAVYASVDTTVFPGVLSQTYRTFTVREI